jgi:SAM-dependent methyltransferase
MSGREVAPDGSPVDVYLAIPPSHGFEVVLPSFGVGDRVLDLGCGVGRLAGLLCDRGCVVTGVDEAAAMLAHVDARVERVEARIDGLDLGRRFDAVVLASHLVNSADDDVRRALLRAAASHLEPGGRFLVEHHHEGTLAAAPRRTGTIGPVEVTFVEHGRDGDVLDAEVTYRLAGRVWTQRFRTRIFDPPGLADELRRVGLVPTRQLSPTWLEATTATA